VELAGGDGDACSTDNDCVTLANNVLKDGFGIGWKAHDSILVERCDSKAPPGLKSTSMKEQR
jgi:hypothetical protein